ncbi:LytTR family DNA-binding domain-containing protein [Marinitoga sp. 38H-ov]|uniref:LytR/AlgR family response regulator transcription factor n=1 Tax=Marinitoga sp. 38H-ov TaxID=1755814 RepID=UPI0013ECF674|nr:LytTR family DNA-binding domain-containing protein [Marinitoga sp. 38H-ov]KAF2955852.1 LytTR family transcriptional regulator [Marinitoga sp. 38H-ov]
MIKVAIIDDEYYARESLKDLITEMTTFEIIGCFESVEDFLKNKKNNDPDVIFLDIELPKLNGIKASKYLNNYKIVFVTAYSEYAVDAFEVNALDYLTKPVSEVRFLETINRIEETLNKKNIITTIAVEHNNEIIFLNFEDIFYFEYFNKNILAITENNEYILKHYKNIGKLETDLPKNFIRIHKSYIINLNYIEKFIKNPISLQMKNKKILPIGKTHLKEIKTILKI